MDFAVPADHKMKLKESEKRDKYLDLVRQLKETTEHESDRDTRCKRRCRYSHQSIGTETGGLGNKRTSGDHPNYSIVKIGLNIKKSP